MRITWYWAKYMGRSGLASEARRSPAHAGIGAAPRLSRGTASLAAALLLAGCGARPEINPVQWWHGLQGGAMAQQRPPPPNADAPYPNLGSVPPKPEMPDPVARQRIASALAVDRANAQYEAKLAPLPNVPHAQNPPGLLGAPSTPTPPDENAASASLEAANAPPAPPAPPTGPAKKPAAAKPAAAPQAGAPAALPSATPEPPVIPAAPPPPPHLAGFPLPATTPTPPPVAPPAPPKPPPPIGAAGTPLPIGFAANSAVLSLPDEQALKSLANRRGSHQVEVVGFGDVTDATPQVQAEGVDLALARARAIVAALNATGVPASAIRMSAQADGRGGLARLVD